MKSPCAAYSLSPLSRGFLHAHERLVARHDLRHARLDGGQVGLGERRLAIDVVEEAVLRRGAVAELGLGKELEDRGRHHMRGGVAQHLQRGLVGLLQQPQLHVFLERGREVHQARAVVACAGRAVHRVFGVRAGVGVGCPAFVAASSRRSGISQRASGRMRAMTTAAASRGEMPVAISRGVVPRATSRPDPSGSWIRICSVLTLYRILRSAASVQQER